jgi:hypothetical protein
VTGLRPCVTEEAADPTFPQIKVKNKKIKEHESIVAWSRQCC